ncbi:MAG: 50S ribosomal protein L7/L12 [Nitrospiraceae bacterium]
MGFALRKHDQPPLSVVAALRRGEKVEAIKLLREDRQIGLKEAKDEVDRYLQANPALLQQMQAKQAAMVQRLQLWVLVLLGIAIMAYVTLIG